VVDQREFVDTLERILGAEAMEGSGGNIHEKGGAGGGKMSGAQLV
jgi:hypothetical protein